MSMPKGWKSPPQTKLDAKRAEKLRQLSAQGVPRAVLRERFGLSNASITNYLNGSSKPAN